MEIVIPEQMVPEDHRLRKIDHVVDLSFIYDLCAPLYCSDNSRPAIEEENIQATMSIYTHVDTPEWKTNSAEWHPKTVGDLTHKLREYRTKEVGGWEPGGFPSLPFSRPADK